MGSRAAYCSLVHNMPTLVHRDGLEIIDDNSERLEQQLYQQRKRYQPETPVDPTWPRRKKSDLTLHMMPQYAPPGRKRMTPERSPERNTQRQEVEVRIRREEKKKGEKQDQMWPRRKKSDLLIYQQTR